MEPVEGAVPSNSPTDYGTGEVSLGPVGALGSSSRTDVVLYLYFKHVQPPSSVENLKKSYLIKEPKTKQQDLQLPGQRTG